jgi:hypothetical protein
MKSIARSFLLSLALITPAIHAAAPDPSLVGCWRVVKIVLHAPDGTNMEDTTGRCILRFRDAELDSACGTSGGTATTVYGYRIVRPHVYAATMASSTFRTSLVGSTRAYEYHVDGDRLVTVSIPPAASPASQAGAPKVESEAERVPCQ